MKTPERLCAEKCPVNYHLGENKECIKCVEDACDNLLFMKTAVKSIFNNLYLRI